MFIVDEIYEAYAKAHSRAEDVLLTELEAETQGSMDCPQMLTGRIEGRLLKMLVQCVQAKYIVEIGLFTGYSALFMAEGLPDDGRLISCEINSRSAALAQQYFDRSPHGHKIEIRMGAALDTLQSLTGPVDFVFMDADKTCYKDYYECLIPKLVSGGLLVMDNALWSGRVLDPPDADSRALADMNAHILQDERVENVVLTVRDGIHLVRKK